MNDETMKNEKNSGVSDAAVSGPPRILHYCLIFFSEKLLYGIFG